MPPLIFKQHKNKSPDKATSTTHKLNKSKKWAKSLTTSRMIRKKCLKSRNIKFNNIKTRLILENKILWSWKNRMKCKEMISKCMSWDFNKWMKEPLILKKSLSLSLGKIIDLEAKLLILKKLCRICMDLEKEKALFTSSWTIWRPIMKSLFSCSRRLVNIKIVKIQKLWEELNTCQIRVSPIFAKLSTSSQTKPQLEEPLRKMVMQMNGSQLKPSKRLKKFKTPSNQEWPKPAFLKFCTNSTSSGETSWEKKTKPSRPNTLYRSKISVDNSSPKKHLMKMSLKETFLVLRKKFNSWLCRFTITNGQRLWPMVTQKKIWTSKIRLVVIVHNKSREN
jgi:hypothetical protein